MSTKRPVTPTSDAVKQFVDSFDKRWFHSNPDKGFRTREPLSGEFTAAEPAPQPGQGAPLVLVIATRSQGRVTRLVRLLRRRPLPKGATA
jgi:hypothetical protein